MRGETVITATDRRYGARISSTLSEAARRYIRPGSAWLAGIPLQPAAQLNDLIEVMVKFWLNCINRMPRLEPKDILTLAMSGVALLVSLISVIINYRQHAREDKRSTRKSLTDTLASLAEVNLAMAKLRLDGSERSDYVVSLRRQYNSQRRYLANHAEFLIEEIPELTTDIDHNLMANAFDSMSDYKRALVHWEKCVERSPAESLRVMNLRGVARFLFFQGGPEIGRQRYEESLKVPLPDSDSNRRLRSDTYALWSSTEREFGFVEEARRRREQAEVEANRIGHIGSRKEMLAYIRSLWGEEPAPMPSPTSPSSERGPLPPRV